jgi:hypothetical protein
VSCRGGGVNAQTPGNWSLTGTNVTTTTNSAVGIGTGTPEGWQEIKFCNSVMPQRGLVITAHDGCGTGPGGGMGGGGAEPGGSEVSYPIIPYLPGLPLIMPAGVGYGTVNAAEPLFLARDLVSPGNTMPNPSPGYENTRFIILPDGSTGINNASPRAMLDVMGGYQNKPTAIFGQKARVVSSTIGTAPNTVAVDKYLSRHIALYSSVSLGQLNSITHAGDLVLTFTDGIGSHTNGASGPTIYDGTNANAGFVIAPMNGSGGGLRMDATGNVMIQGKLELRGELRCNGFKSQPVWWPDFVFEKNYHLMPLDSLRTYVNTYKHLPSMPSRDSILANGQDIALIQQLQQQKIEELTLYVIELKKEIDFLRKEIIDEK